MPQSIRPEHASFVQRNGLTLAFAALMLLSLVGHALTGWSRANEDHREHGEAPEAFAHYLGSGEFLSTLFENWESEFLQMGLFVLLTAHLRQHGASESRPLDLAEEKASEEPLPPVEQRPWPVRRGGAWRKVYEHSLSGALLVLFAISFALHGYNSWRDEVEDSARHREPPPTLVEHVTGPGFWFESFQNWQSEFLAVVSLVLLSIVLREKDSTESKRVEDPHSKTGA
ncbi:DUF6766 family protein [Lysobacter humi (ex Lee et al. 2017)]